MEQCYPEHTHTPSVHSSIGDISDELKVMPFKWRWVKTHHWQTLFWVHIKGIEVFQTSYKIGSCLQSLQEDMFFTLFYYLK